MKNWKIRNVAKDNQEIKVSIATSNSTAPGIILKPGQFCIAEARMTAPLDAQTRRGYIKIEKDFDNSVLNLTLGKAFDESELDKAKASADEYLK